MEPPTLYTSALVLKAHIDEEDKLEKYREIIMKAYLDKLKYLYRNNEIKYLAKKKSCNSFTTIELFNKLISTFHLTVGFLDTEHDENRNTLAFSLFSNRIKDWSFKPGSTLSNVDPTLSNVDPTLLNILTSKKTYEQIIRFGTALGAVMEPACAVENRYKLPRIGINYSNAEIFKEQYIQLPTVQKRNMGLIINLHINIFHPELISCITECVEKFTPVEFYTKIVGGRKLQSFKI